MVHDLLIENDLISKTLLTIDKFKSLNQFKQAIIDDEYNPNSKYFIRSLIWKTIFITEGLNIQTWQSKLNDSRRIYHELVKDNDMNIPWFKLDNESPYFQPIELSKISSLKRLSSKKIKQKTILTRVSVDPLNSSSDNSKHDTDDNLELLRIIILDIDRIFPGESFFNSINYKRQLIEILFVWSKCNPKISYKQGFHEILGLIFKNIYQDCVNIPKTNTMSADDIKVLSLYDLNYLSHDIFTIFNKFMNNFGIIHNYYENESILIREIEKFNKYLMKVDQLIHYNLISKLKLESQLWCIRYFRLIFLREFGNNNLVNISYLWDKLITVEPNKFSYLMIFIIIIMLINLKSQLIVCDFSESLSLLLHYPVNSNIESFEFFGCLFQDACKLLSNKDNDLKLYELGLKINEIFNPDLKISLSFNGRTSSESVGSRASSPSSTVNVSRSVSPLRTASSFINGFNNLSLTNNKSISNQNSSTQANQQHLGLQINQSQRAEKLAFEKLRLEMRLKKKAQQIMRP